MSRACCWGLVIFVIAIALLTLGTVNGVSQRARKEQCTVTSCDYPRPNDYPVLHYVSVTHPNRVDSVHVYGCDLFPVNSTITCYIGSDFMSLDKPGSGEWIAMVVIGSIALLISLCTFCANGPECNAECERCDVPMTIGLYC
jgi:hypothetical protein